jgi:hypothetical protein
MMTKMIRRIVRHTGEREPENWSGGMTPALGMLDFCAQNGVHQLDVWGPSSLGVVYLEFFVSNPVVCPGLKPHNSWATMWVGEWMILEDTVLGKRQIRWQKEGF